MTPVKINNLVPLCYLSPYKDNALYIRARVYNAVTNALLATKDLTPFGEGRYTDASFFMPNVSLLKVRYDVYSDSGYSAVNEVEGSVDDGFYLADTQEALIRNDELILVFSDSGEGLELSFLDKADIEVTYDERDESLETVYDAGTLMAVISSDEDEITAEFID